MSEALRGVLNSGFNRNCSVAVDTTWEPRAFSTFAAVELEFGDDLDLTNSGAIGGRIDSV